MIILQMSGGLGNQMFQYAMFLKLKSLGYEVKFDDEETYRLDNARPIQLGVFGIDYPKASREEIIRMTDGSLKLTARIRRKITGRKTKEYRENGFHFDQGALQANPSYLIGNFQSDKYFADIKEEVYRAFTFRTDVADSKTLELEKEIGAVNAVCMHVRRGDYLAVPGVYGEICTDAYYDGAMEYVQKQMPDAVFYLFTNDPDWARTFIHQRPQRRIHLVEGNTEDTGYLDLYLMTKCKHFIIANSSFSWWGSYLGSAPDKLVIAPAKWYQDRECPDIYTDEMVIVDANGGVCK